MGDLQIWDRRWKALLKVISQLNKDISNLDEQLETDAEKKEHRIPTLKKLVLSLEDFSQKQFEFFFNGFDQDNGTLEESVKFPPEYVLRNTLDQISVDLMVIEAAFKQRKDSIMRAALKQADLLAYRSIEPVLNKSDNGDNQKKLLPEKSTIVTYFQKVPQVRIIPYGYVTLVGLPYTAAADLEYEPYDKDSNLRDLLAIPHEVGHFVFWSGRLNGERLHILLRQKLVQVGLGKYGHWLEEMFADVYGTLVAGSGFALSAQDIQLDNLPARVIKDDGSHPAGVLRPHISLKALDSNSGAQNLEMFWRERLEKFGQPTTFELNDQINAPETIYVETAILEPQNGTPGGSVSKIVQLIIDALDTNAFENKWSINTPDPPTDRHTLYESFANKLKNDSKLNYLQAFDDVPDDFDVPDVTDSWVHLLRDGVNSDTPMPAEVWKIVFFANGWGTGGGDSDGAGKDIE